MTASLSLEQKIALIFLIERIANKNKEKLLQECRLPIFKELSFNIAFNEPPFHWFEKHIKQIHYSWLAPILIEEKDPIRSGLSSILSETQRQQIVQHAAVKFLLKPSPIFHPIFLDLFKAKLHMNDHEPIFLMPPSPFLSLLEWKKEDLVNLTSLIALSELAPEIRHIVDKNRLMALYGALTTLQQKHLKQCLHQRGLTRIPKNDLRTWNGNEDELQRVLHKLGIKLLAIGLKQEHSDLGWHLAHIFDIGRGTRLIKQLQEKHTPQEVSLAQQQLVQAMKAMKDHP